ncbi:hypothetical protein AbraIFM66951_002916 [Aspergillus brasiliensis]|uniref:Uncharacterized protein n=1 Tax=Aspergillus brasiliensis TaxID=319629 RepID=A0A9W5YRA8_9EURO|nr:hypothetical protein AbraCBS73388_008572 [Aspergillus brasiliensis]GKZ50069.1 hypothetical protein AbraIFM66951_002916 [Aspergillus brasiliensis]
MFLDEELPPNAILIESREILDDIQHRGSAHTDLKPRDMTVSLADEWERVLWIDLNSAQTFLEGDLSPRQRRWFEEEYDMMD